MTRPSSRPSCARRRTCCAHSSPGRARPAHATDHTRLVGRGVRGNLLRLERAGRRPIHEALRRSGHADAMAAPLRDGGRITACCWSWTASTTSARSTARTPELFEALAGHASVALTNARPGRPGPGRRSRDRAPVAARPAHRAAQPAALPRSAWRSGCSPPGRRGAADGPRPLQGGQRHARPRRRRPAAASRSAGGCGALEHEETWWPGSAATSSPCCSRERTTSASQAWSQRAQRATSREPFDLGGVDLDVERQHRHRRRARHDGADAAALLRRADVAMYDAKRSLRRRARYYAPTRPATAPGGSRPDQRARARARARRTLERALPAAGRAATRAASPASRRWCAGGTRVVGCIPPDEFIPLAEQTGADPRR